MSTKFWRCLGRYSPAIILAIWAVLASFGAAEGRVVTIIMLAAVALAVTIAETIRIGDLKRIRRRREREHTIAQS